MRCGNFMTIGQEVDTPSVYAEPQAVAIFL